MDKEFVQCDSIKFCILVPQLFALFAEEGFVVFSEGLADFFYGLFQVLQHLFGVGVVVLQVEEELSAVVAGLLYYF